MNNKIHIDISKKEQIESTSKGKVDRVGWDPAAKRRAEQIEAARAEAFAERQAQQQQQTPVDEGDGSEAVVSHLTVQVRA